jgi:hypothetical protein
MTGDIGFLPKFDPQMYAKVSKIPVLQMVIKNK